MMATYAIVESGVVTNVIVWEGVAAFIPPNGTILVEIPAGTYTGVGATYANGVFGPPPNTRSIM